MLGRSFRTVGSFVCLTWTALAFAGAPRTPRPITPAVAPAERPAAFAAYQTPVQREVIPFLQAHAGSPTAKNADQDAAGTSYVTTPNFGGYRNAPTYAGRTTASLDTGAFDDGVSAEVTADFNKDGKPDIATLQEDGTLNILLNSGSGTLDAPVSYYNPNFLTTNVFTAYAVDVNDDGNPDVIAYDEANDTMITWLNLGNGTFGAAITTPVDPTYGSPNSVLVADVNGDGKPDLIYAMSQNLTQTTSNVVLEVNLGNGDGTFAAPTAAQVQQFPVAASVNAPANGIAVGDLNGDGKPDIAVALDTQTSQKAGTYIVTTALGNGDGSFSALDQTIPISAATSGPFAAPFSSTGVQLLDLNKDNYLDVASDINGVLMVALGNGNGGFASAVSSQVYGISQLNQLQFGDVNGDGIPDMVAGGGTLATFLGNGDGTFATPAAGAEFIIDPTQSLVLADFNGDGSLDVAELGADYKQVALFLNNGSGGFPGAPLVAGSTNPAGLDWMLESTGVYTSSGYSDAEFLQATATGTALTTGLSDGKGNFSYVPSLAAGLPSGFAFVEPVQADFNGDGMQDLLLADATGGLSVALSNGNGTFATPVSVGLPAAACPVSYAAAGDVNGDGKTDIVVPYGGDASCGSSGSGQSGYYVLLGNGNGTFAAPVFTPDGSQLYSVTLADINNDGNLDLVIDDTPFVSGSGFNVSVALGSGNGAFAAANPVLSNYVVAGVAVADINNDGKPDLILGSEEAAGGTLATGSIVLLTGNGDGTFNSPSQIATGNFFLGLQAADMNNDGNIDIVGALSMTNGQPNTYYGMVTLLGFGNGEFAAPYNQLESLDSTLPQVGNFYNDNAPDVMTNSGYGPALFLGQGGSSIALAASAAQAAFGAPETFTATIAASMSGRPSPTGAVSFYDGTTLLGQGSVSSGAASLTTATLAAGAHSITAAYSGDSNFNPNTSAASTVTITAVAPAITLAGTPSTLSLTSGANGLVTLTLAANATYSGNVTLTCSGAPATATCAVNPGSVTLAAGQSATATLVVGASGTQAKLEPTGAPWESAGAAVSAAMLGGLFFGRRRLRALSALGLVLLLSTGALLTGCGGGSGSGTTTTTAPSSFTVTVTATPAAGNAATAQTATVSVTVS